MALGWSAANPGKASLRLMLLILPSFMLSGAQLSVAMLPPSLQYVSNILPLTWHFKFLRGMGFKGGSLKYFIPELGGFLILLLLIFILIALKKIKLAKNEDAAVVVEPVLH